MKKLSVLGSVLLLVFVGIFSSGCLEDEEDEAKVDCAETFCIGTLLPEGEVFNGPLIEAVDLAKSDINKAGGNIEIISGNSFKAGQEVGEAIASATRLIDMGVRGIVAPSYSSDSLEVLPFLSYNQIVSISPSATSTFITVENEKIVDQHFFFRVAPSDFYQASILANQSQGDTVIVNRDDAWGGPLSKSVEEKIMSAGRQVEVVSYSSTAPVISDVVSEVEEAVRRIQDVESIVVLAFDNEGGTLIKGLLDSSVIPEETGYYVGDGLVFKDTLLPLVGSRIKGFKQVIPTPPPGKRLDEFKERFNFGDFAAHAYDAVVILSLAALSAGSNDPSVYVSEIQKVTREGTECHSYAACAEALTDDDDIDYEGLSGSIDLDKNGDITAGFYAVDTYDAQGVQETTYLNFQGEEVGTD